MVPENINSNYFFHILSDEKIQWKYLILLIISNIWALIFFIVLSFFYRDKLMSGVAAKMCQRTIVTNI